MVPDETNKLIRICFVSPKAYPLFNPGCKGVFGGAEVDLFSLGGELARDPRYKVSLITADYGQPEEETRDDIGIIRSLDFSQNALRGACRIQLGRQISGY